MIHGYNAEKQSSSSFDYPCQKHLKSHQSSFNRKTVIFIAKGSSSSYNKFPVLLGKKALLFSTLPTFIQKEKFGWASQSDLWASQPFCLPNVSIFPKSLLKTIKLQQS